MSRKVGVIGFGKWGKALAEVLTDSGNTVMVYTRQNCNDLIKSHSNLLFSNSLSKVVNFSNISVITTKASDVENIVRDLTRKNLKMEISVISSKGFSDNGDLLSNILNGISTSISVIGGPNFAHEIIDRKLTVATLAGDMPDIFSNSYFKVERSNDIIGLQVSSIMKNIYAIGCGVIAAGFNSENTKAAFITMAFNELMTAIELFGGVRETAYKACGLGDLVLTCYSGSSRNHIFGEMLVNGNVNEGETVEGYSSIIKIKPEVREMLPLCNAIYNFIHGQINLDQFRDTLFKD
jgi:glycerol-3-phosphate dehydrogenase (NAD(P)+)